MFNKKKLALVAGGVLTLGALAACGPSAGATNTITIWCPPTDKETVEAIIADFKEANPDYADWTIEVSKTVGEGETQALLTADKTNSADVICMADDNIRTAVQGETLLALTDEEKAAIVASDGQEAVDACSIDGTLYGYPYRGDNSYMLFYDTTVVSADQAKSVEGILAACKAAGKTFNFNLTEGWYSTSPFIGHGLSIGVKTEEDGKIYMNTDFYSTKGAQIAQQVMDLRNEYGSTWVFDVSNSTVEKGFAEGTMGATILWNDYNTFIASNKNIAVSELPTLTVGTTAAQLTPFLGYKAVVINNYVESRGDECVAAARAFAKFMTNEDNQKTYQTELGYGMTNLNVMEEADLSNNPFLNAINAQLPNVVPQGVNVTNDFWDPMQTFWANVATGNWGDYGTGLDGAKGALRALVSTTGWVTTELINNGTIA